MNVGKFNDNISALKAAMIVLSVFPQLVRKKISITLCTCVARLARPQHLLTVMVSDDQVYLCISLPAYVESL